jgi:hypothetical protein
VVDRWWIEGVFHARRVSNTIEDVKLFFRRWKFNNVNAEGYEQKGDLRAARRLADQCRASAEREGITSEQLDEAAADMIGGDDDLIELMSNAIEQANDDEVQRHAEKDD